MSLILGINSHHADSSACIVKDGLLVAAVEEERFNRIKHWAGFPVESIKYCLSEVGANINDIDHVALNTDPRKNRLKKIVYTIKNKPSINYLLERYQAKNKRLNVEDELNKSFNANVTAIIHYVEHHLSHLASASMVSPFNNSIAVSVDGFGDFSSLAWAVCKENGIQTQERVFFPHSLGIFYQAITQYIGFKNYGDEYKMMGLAPYGRPSYLKKMRDLITIKDNGLFSLNLDYFCHHKNKVSLSLGDGAPFIDNLFMQDKMVDLFGFMPRLKEEEVQKHHIDLAHSAQAMYEEVLFNLLNVTHNKCGIDNLSLAGGCAMNSVANGKVRRETAYKNVYVQSAAGDAGGAIGAALVVADKLKDIKKRQHMDHAYWGPSFSNDYCEKLLNKRSNDLRENGCTFKYIDDDTLFVETAKHISEGEVIGWFQGRMEWGPRALGNRSILGDPRRGDMKDILNKKIKKRESFRPFAPSILREHVSEWFEEDAEVPFMMQVFQVSSEKRALIPAVTHVDGSGRLQTVSNETNEKYYKLIQAFNSITNVPIILNTSFNENEPVVCKPEEALNTFLRTNMDILVLGNWFIQRQDA